ncbi:ABC transporter substrate binding protein [Bradyrhizobium sp. RDI18]|uniref:ABC transporter substrate binding protein n=1 Tax=Bradyrhizobium sp. RDI18 TaxID=3367400 RepID=UPI0037212C2A
MLDGLQNYGWIECRNPDYRVSFFQPPDRLPASVADLIALSPGCAHRRGTAGNRSPEIGNCHHSDCAPVWPAILLGFRLVQSLSRPGGNITGLTTVVPEDFLGKRIEILRELVPGASKIALLVNPGNPMHRLTLAEEYLSRTARKLSMALPIVEATTAEELDVAFASAAAQHVDAIVDVGDVLTWVEAPRVIALAAKYHLPANYFFRHSAKGGGLSVYGRYIRSVPSCSRLRR